MGVDYSKYRPTGRPPANSMRDVRGGQRPGAAEPADMTPPTRCNSSSDGHTTAGEVVSDATRPRLAHRGAQRSTSVAVFADGRLRIVACVPASLVAQMPPSLLVHRIDTSSGAAADSSTHRVVTATRDARRRRRHGARPATGAEVPVADNALFDIHLNSDAGETPPHLHKGDSRDDLVSSITTTGNEESPPAGLASTDRPAERPASAMDALLAAAATMSPNLPNASISSSTGTGTSSSTGTKHRQTTNGPVQPPADPTQSRFARNASPSPPPRPVLFNEAAVRGCAAFAAAVEEAKQCNAKATAAFQPLSFDEGDYMARLAALRRPTAGAGSDFGDSSLFQDSEE